jgi:hypothetical protein
LATHLGWYWLMTPGFCSPLVKKNETPTCTCKLKNNSTTKHKIHASMVLVLGTSTINIRTHIQYMKTQRHGQRSMISSHINARRTASSNPVTIKT